ncbi:MAG: EAL domain-containing protein [Proteobacteria bacterium]|nr:EAL domain-containing protein [Pseudomonadota bacterium]
MQPKSLSGILTSGVGRRIVGLFVLAGILPVIVTALFAYFEVGRGLEKEATRQLREHSKSFGVEVLERIVRTADKAEEIVRIVESGNIASIDDHRYLLNDFSEIVMLSSTGSAEQIYGDPELSASLIEQLRNGTGSGRRQLVLNPADGKSALLLLHGEANSTQAKSAFGFRFDQQSLWRVSENHPFQTDVCAFTVEGEQLFCSKPIDPGLHAALTGKGNRRTTSPTKWMIEGEEHFAAAWQLFLATGFAQPGIDIVSVQPTFYALRSGADFRRVFPPALALVIILVGALSLTLIGESLVPLQRLTLVARQFAAGHLESRVRVLTNDEFATLGDAFNDMASRLARQIDTMKAMSRIDRLILSGADFEEVSEKLIEQLIDLTGVEAAAVIARDTDASDLAKMISRCSGEFIHERIALPKDLGLDWCQPKQVEVVEVDGESAPYKERFLAFGLKYVVIIPVVLNKELKGILLLGSDANIEMQSSRLGTSVELAGRLAVALASAERGEALYRQAHFDELTGLPNRQLLKDRLEQHLTQSRREDHNGALLFIDLDRFKEINDVFGHSVGDIVLAQAAERILSEVRETDTVARLGGDEFVIVMPKLVGDNIIRATATRMLTRLGEAFSVRGKQHFLGASIGIVVFPEDGGSVETLLKNADSAMYRAKEAGRSRFEFFSKKLNAESRRKIELERDLRVAVDQGQLDVRYQPQFDLKSGSICGAEALLRWTHDSLGEVAPAEFIQLAEDSGLIVEIGRWVVDRTCADFRKILDKGLHPGSMSINVSARQLREATFTSDVMDTLRRHDIHPGFLQVEITETAVAQNRDTAIKILNQLRESGVQLAIDDFGTGYSSLSYLQQLPFDRIKIDRSFVELIGSGGNSENICRTIIKMAHELGKESIAEGVERREQVDFLIENGCNSVQGYFYSYPLSWAEFLAFVEKQDAHTQRRKALEIVS